MFKIEQHAKFDSLRVIVQATPETLKVYDLYHLEQHETITNHQITKKNFEQVWKIDCFSAFQKVLVIFWNVYILSLHVSDILYGLQKNLQQPHNPIVNN